MSFLSMTGNINAEIIAAMERFNRGLLDKKKALVKNYGTSLGQAVVLKFLSDKGQMTVPQIARRLGVSRQNIQVIVNKLNGAGQVLADNNPDHQLSPLILLTEKGQQTSKVLSDQEKELFDQIFNGINLGEKTIFLKLLNSAK